MRNMRTLTINRRRLAAGLLALLAAPLALADREDRHAYASDSRRQDHERARSALSRGEIRPIAEILTMVAAQVPGEIVEVELERAGSHGGRGWLYELKIITPDDRLVEVLVDATSGRVLDVEDE